MRAARHLQETNEEDRAQRNLTGRRELQPPDHWGGDGEDEYVQEDVRDEVRFQIHHVLETVGQEGEERAVERPEVGTALEEDREEEAYGPQHHEPDHDLGADVEDLAAEDASVEIDDGELDGAEGQHLDQVEGELALPREHERVVEREHVAREARRRAIGSRRRLRQPARRGTIDQGDGAADGEDNAGQHEPVVDAEANVLHPPHVEAETDGRAREEGEEHADGNDTRWRDPKHDCGRETRTVVKTVGSGTHARAKEIEINGTQL